MAKHDLPMETEITWFLLASTLDLAFTGLALRFTAAGLTRGRFIESNPVANWVLQHWGFMGMAAFKLAIAGFVIGIALVIEPRRPRTARGLLLGATLVVGIVVVHTVRLLLLHRA